MDELKEMTALKEWSAAIHALLDGRQAVLLRKGGIHEKRFTVAASEFLLFPTVAHSHAQRVRHEHRELLGAAQSDSTDDRVLVRAAAKVVGVIEVCRPENLPEIEDLHIWTTDSVRADRLDFRPRHRLTVLVVQAMRLAAPIELVRSPEFAGCKSWIDVPATPEFGAPVRDSAELRDITQRVAAIVG